MIKKENKDLKEKLNNEIKEKEELKEKLNNEIKEKEELKIKIENIELNNKKIGKELNAILDKINRNESKNMITAEENDEQIFKSNRIKDDYQKYYEILEKICRGAYSNIYKVKDKKTNELRAMKIIDIDDNSNEEDKEYMIKRIIDSIKIMEICCNKNNNSVKIYEFFQSKEEIVLIMELCDNIYKGS